MGTTPTLDERDRRIARIRDEMQKEDLDALLIAGKGHGWTGRGYFRYLTDFHIWGHDGMILLPMEGEPMLTFTSSGVGDMIAERGWITDTRADWDVAPTIVQEMKERGLDRGKVGIAGEKMILPKGVYDILETGLPRVQFVNADGLMNRVRAVKSEVEHQQIREVWDTASDALELFVDELEPGRTERELSAEPVRYIHENGARDYLIFFNGIPGDDVVGLEGVVKYHMEIMGPSGHWCEITVQPTYDEPSDDQLRLMESELRAYERVREAATPGTTLRELAGVFEETLRDDGWEIDDEQSQQLHHYDFHGQGLDWIEWPRWSPNDPKRHDTELEPGMYINYHPYRVLEADVGRTGINDGMLITEDGGERIYPDWDLGYRVME